MSPTPASTFCYRIQLLNPRIRKDRLMYFCCSLVPRKVPVLIQIPTGGRVLPSIPSLPILCQVPVLQPLNQTAILSSEKKVILQIFVSSSFTELKQGSSHLYPGSIYLRPFQPLRLLAVTHVHTKNTILIQTLLQILLLKLCLKDSMQNIPHMQISYLAIQLKFLSRLISLLFHINIPFSGFQKCSSDVAISIVMVFLSFYNVPFPFLTLQWILLCCISHTFFWVWFQYTSQITLYFTCHFFTAGGICLTNLFNTMYWPPVLC